MSSSIENFINDIDTFLASAPIIHSEWIKMSQKPIKIDKGQLEQALFGCIKWLVWQNSRSNSHSKNLNNIIFNSNTILKNTYACISSYAKNKIDHLRSSAFSPRAFKWFMDFRLQVVFLLCKSRETSEFGFFLECYYSLSYHQKHNPMYTALYVKSTIVWNTMKNKRTTNRHTRRIMIRMYVFVFKK